MKMIKTPISEEVIEKLKVGDMVHISGKIYCGRDAVLPKICRLIDENRLEEYGIDLQGSVVFHTAVSPAGVGPTSSNKLEIEGSFPTLSRAGVKLHLGKGAIGIKTIYQRWKSINRICSNSACDSSVRREYSVETNCSVSRTWYGRIL